MGKIGKGAKREKGKRIKAHDSTPPKVDYDKQPPLFFLTNICKTYCLSKCGKDEKAAFADTLHRLAAERRGAVPCRGSCQRDLACDYTSQTM